jgi:hypothetical protein
LGEFSHASIYESPCVVGESLLDCAPWRGCVDGEYVSPLPSEVHIRFDYTRLGINQRRGVNHVLGALFEVVPSDNASLRSVREADEVAVVGARFGE